MKQLLSKKTEAVTDNEKLVYWYPSNQGLMPIDPPKPAGEMECVFCGNRSTISCFGEKGLERVWLCGNADCSRSRLPNEPRLDNIATSTKRAILWPLFCEINHVGDDNHGVRFENIHQPQEKVAYMRKFAESPASVIVMQGSPGVGKTYASLGMCEYYTRTSVSCCFLTQKQLAEKWLFDRNSVRGCFNCEMLVIDDFGISDLPTGFMSYFMELMNSRIQWANKGTVITTNLQGSALTRICGDALMDRLMTGQIFNFSGPSRRTKKAL